MGMQISCGIHPEVSAQGALQGAAAPLGSRIPVAYGAEGMPRGGRAFDAGSCAYAAECAAEVCGVAGGGLHQGQERDTPGANVWRTATQLRGAALLGEGILRFDGGP